MQLSSHTQPVSGLAALLAVVGALGAPSLAGASGGPDSTLQNFTGSTQAVCPCFIPTEEAGVVLEAPAAHYPIEILRVGIAWGSQFGGSPSSLEQAIHIYSDDLPNPGTPIFTLPGPVLNDGVFNEFNLEPIAGQIVIPSDSFTVTLEFLNQNAGQIFAPSVVHDGNGCQPGLNVVNASPGGWADACQLGVTGDWVMYVVYRACGGTVGIEPPQVIASQPVMLMPARPNPFTAGTSLDFFLAEGAEANIGVFDVAGRRVATLGAGAYAAGTHHLTWDGRRDGGGRLQSGTYFIELESGGHRSMRKVVLTD